MTEGWLPRDGGSARAAPSAATARPVRLRLAWWHPSLTDYRRALFELIAERCDLRLVLMRGGVLRPGMARPAALATADIAIHEDARRAVASHPGQLSWRALGALLARIRGSDAFVTSFSLNLYSLIGMAWARWLGVPVVVWEEMQRLPHRGRAAALRRWLLRRVVDCADAWFVMGTPQRELLRELGVPAQRIFESAEAPALCYAQVPAETVALPFGGERPVVLYLGRLIPIKGVDGLLRAFAHLQRSLPEAALVIAGDGPQRPALEARARELGLHAVVFLGHVAEDGRKAWLLRRAHVLAVPSVYLGDWGEGGPLVIPEALSAGTPVVCTEACGNTVDAVRRVGHGAVVPPADPAALAEALAHHLRQAPDREAICRAARALPGHAHQAETLWRALQQARLHRLARGRTQGDGAHA